MAEPRAAGWAGLIPNSKTKSPLFDFDFELRLTRNSKLETKNDSNSNSQLELYSRRGGCWRRWGRWGNGTTEYTEYTERFSMSLSLELEFESGIGDCLVRGFDRINGIYRIG